MGLALRNCGPQGVLHLCIGDNIRLRIASTDYLDLWFRLPNVVNIQIGGPFASLNSGMGIDSLKLRWDLLGLKPLWDDERLASNLRGEALTLGHPPHSPKPFIGPPLPCPLESFCLVDPIHPLVLEEQTLASDSRKIQGRPTPDSGKKKRGRPRKLKGSGTISSNNEGVIERGGSSAKRGRKPKRISSPSPSSPAASGEPRGGGRGSTGRYFTRAQKVWMLGKVLGLQYEGSDANAIASLEGELNTFLPRERNGENLDIVECSRPGAGGEEEGCEGAPEEGTTGTCAASRNEVGCTEGEASTELRQISEL